MSLRSRMREQFAVYARTAESDAWTRRALVLGGLTVLSAEGARRQSPLAEADVTHSGRFPVNEHIQAGRRLRRMSDNAEFLVRGVREQGPPPNHYHVLCAEVEPSLT